MKFRVVEDCRGAWPVQALCHVLGISTAGYIRLAVAAGEQACG